MCAKMKDLLQSQIKEQCNLNIPDGLKELMSDISREVLRAQPSNIYKFIADYLSAMLVTRDSLSITAQVCNHLCDCDCQTALLSELQKIGLDDVDIEAASDVIMTYLNKGKVNEGNLLSILMKKTNIDPSKFPEVLNAIRTAYLRQHSLNTIDYEKHSMSGDAEIENARIHTLDLYWKAKPTQEMYQAAADKIKVSYRAYGVRRGMERKKDHLVPPKETSNLDSIYIDEIGINSVDSVSEDLRNELELTASMFRNRMSTVSSLSLAGSFSCLPKLRSYNGQNIEYLSELEESSEKEHSNIDYTTGQSTTEINPITTDANIIKCITNDQVIVTSDDNKIFYDIADELIDESVTVFSNKSDDNIEVIDESLHEGSDQDSLNFVPDEELDSERLDYDDDYDVINDDRNKDDLNMDSDSESNEILTEVP